MFLMMVFMSHASYHASLYQKDIKMVAWTREQQAVIHPPSPHFLFSMQLPGNTLRHHHQRAWPCSSHVYSSPHARPVSPLEPPFSCGYKWKRGSFSWGWQLLRKKSVKGSLCFCIWVGLLEGKKEEGNKKREERAFCFSFCLKRGSLQGSKERVFFGFVLVE